MATADHWFLNVKLSKVNFNGLIIQLEQIFWKISSIFWLFLSKYCWTNLFESLSTINWFIGNQTQTMKIGPKSRFS